MKHVGTERFLPAVENAIRRREYEEDRRRRETEQPRVEMDVVMQDNGQRGGEGWFSWLTRLPGFRKFLSYTSRHLEDQSK